MLLLKETLPKAAAEKKRGEELHRAQPATAHRRGLYSGHSDHAGAQQPDTPFAYTVHPGWVYENKGRGSPSLCLKHLTVDTRAEHSMLKQPLSVNHLYEL